MRLHRIFKKNDQDQFVALLDELYRVEVADFARLLERNFGVILTAGKHSFVRHSDKIGASGIVRIIDEPRSIEGGIFVRGLSKQYVILTSNSMTSFRFVSDSQEYELQFESADAPSAKIWAKTLAKNCYGFAATFLYLFNRLRASEALDRRYNDELELFADLAMQLRSDECDIGQVLRKFSEFFGFDWTTVSLVSPVGDAIVPLFCSDRSIRDRLCRQDISALASYSLLASSIGEPQVVPLPESAAQNCNCDVFAEAGAKTAVHVGIESQARLQGRHPRAILSFYRKLSGPVESRERSALRQMGREIAKWIDRADHQAEHEIVAKCIRDAEAKCSRVSRRYVNEGILHDLARDVGRALARLLPFAQDGDEEQIYVALIAGDRVFGDLGPTFELVSEAERPSAGSGILVVDQRRSDKGFLLWRAARENGAMLLIGAALFRIGTLRPATVDLICQLLELVYEVVLVEQRRSVWTQRIVHEVRQPLQGMVAMASEIQAMAQNVSVPRREIAHYAEDVQTSIQRMKTLLTVFNSVSGVEQFTPAPRPTLLEKDVIRPMRRLLAPYAMRRGITLLPTQGYGAIPTLVTDPDLIGTILYNLVDNAIKYAASGSEILIRCDSEDTFFEIAVENHGNLIPPDEVDRIFDFQFRGKLARQIDSGLGMGLFHVAQIAKKLDFKVELRQFPPDLVKFCVRIPRREE